MSDPIEVLDFWLGAIGPADWYSGSQEVDDACAANFSEILQALRDDGLEHWIDGPAATLAYIIVADQFSRNVHRGTADAFATDAKALNAAKIAVEKGWDLEAPEPERHFFYMPFEHSEDMADQDMAVQLMQERMPSDPHWLLHAKAHREMIQRYGRFPLRNKALGRESTPAEEAFLAEGGYVALVNSLS